MGVRLYDGHFEADVFETDAELGKFTISITEESNWSTDGGYSFENVTNSKHLSKENAKCLLDELQHFIDNN